MNYNQYDLDRQRQQEIRQQAAQQQAADAATQPTAQIQSMPSLFSRIKRLKDLRVSVYFRSPQTQAS